MPARPLLLLLPLLVLLAGCRGDPGSQDPNAAPGTELRRGNGGDPGSLDPVRAEDLPAEHAYPLPDPLWRDHDGPGCPKVDPIVKVDAVRKVVPTDGVDLVFIDIGGSTRQWLVLKLAGMYRQMFWSTLPARCSQIFANLKVRITVWLRSQI